MYKIKLLISEKVRSTLCGELIELFFEDLEGWKVPEKHKSYIRSKSKKNLEDV